MYGVVLHAHPVRGESHNQRNTTGEVATVCTILLCACVHRVKSEISLDTGTSSWVGRMLSGLLMCFSEWLTNTSSNVPRLITMHFKVRFMGE